MGFLFLRSMSGNTDEQINLPEEAAGLPLVDIRSGHQAIAEINRMHGLDFSFTAAKIGVYGVDGQAILWLSELDTKFHAQQMLVDMRDRIALGNSPYTPLDAWKDGGRMVYELDGHGQIHYYFQSERLVVWLAVQPSLADQAIGEVLAFYP